MRKHRSPSGQTCSVAFQEALDNLSIVGTWELDAVTCHARIDAFVAMLFGIDPQAAEGVVPLAAIVAAIHADDRERVSNLIHRAIEHGSPYIAEYRVHSVDGTTRWVLSRGRFYCDHSGRPLCGRGVIVDITRARARAGENEGAVGITDTMEPPLDRAAEHAIAMQKAVAELDNPALKTLADALLLGLGRELAHREVQERRKRMN